MNEVLDTHPIAPSEDPVSAKVANFKNSMILLKIEEGDDRHLTEFDVDGVIAKEYYGDRTELLIE